MTDRAKLKGVVGGSRYNTLLTIILARNKTELNGVELSKSQGVAEMSRGSLHCQNTYVGYIVS